AAPSIAVTAALIPPIAEASWRGGHALKVLLWWAVLVPAAAVVFFSSSERVHVAKGGAQSDRIALRGAAGWARAALTKAREGASRSQHSAGSEAVRFCLQDQARGRSGGKHRRGSCKAGASPLGGDGHHGQASSGTDVAPPYGARSGRLHGDLDCPRAPFGAG